ncbi:MAG: paraquat-inducible protein B, partial [Pseudomonadota bacterium]
LASARDAATAVANATEILPDLALRLEGMVGQAEELVGAYDGRSTFNAETLEALREIQDAARAVSRLARAIERDPNSIILGR